MLVHERLSEAGLVELIVTHLTVTNEVNDDVVVELLAVLRRDLETMVHSLHVVRIDMEDRSADSLGEVRSIHVTAALGRHSRETNLVVHDDVNSATDAVVLQVLHLHSFVDDTLAGESGVTMDEDGHNGVKITSLTHSLSNVVLSSATAHDDGVDALKMRRIGEDFDGKLLATLISSRERSTQVILDITRGISLSRTQVGHNSLELSKNCSQRLTHHIGEHVEAATMGHSDNDFVGAMLEAGIHADLHARNECLDTFETESLHRVKLLRDKLGEAISPK